MEEHKENINTKDVNVKMSATREEEEEKTCSRICPSAEPDAPASQSSSDFSHPVYKEIAVANGHINRMSKDDLRIKLSELKLDTRGVKDVMKKRLKSHYKKQKLLQSTTEGGATDTYYDYICVVDFEATCEEDNPPDFLHEIIEFPMVLVSTHTLEIVDSFQEYVKPQLNPQLSDFCVKLTGITQKMVDDADPFPEVLQRVVVWLQERELGTKYKYAILTDGAWDMSKFLNIQCRLSDIRYPQFAKKWINIRKSYGNFYKVPRTQTKLSTMLEKRVGLCVCVCVCVRAGGPGVVSDPRVEAGAAAAAAAADGAAGTHRCQSAAGQVHQHHAGHRHRHPGVRLHGRQVHRPAAAEPPPPGAHLRGRLRAGAAVEELGTSAGPDGESAAAALSRAGEREPITFDRTRGPGLQEDLLSRQHWGGVYMKPYTSHTAPQSTCG